MSCCKRRSKSLARLISPTCRKILSQAVSAPIDDGNRFSRSSACWTAAARFPESSVSNACVPSNPGCSGPCCSPAFTLANASPVRPLARWILASTLLASTSAGFRFTRFAASRSAARGSDSANCSKVEICWSMVDDRHPDHGSKEMWQIVDLEVVDLAVAVKGSPIRVESEKSKVEWNRLRFDTVVHGNAVNVVVGFA
jgi:hypothetical protein